jgi:hypothetical protein
MKILLMLVSLMFMGCAQEREEPLNYYPTYSDYRELLTSLDGVDIDSSIIEQNLLTLNIASGYPNISYSDGQSICYSVTWGLYHSNAEEYIYYITMNIWAINGILDFKSCNYYSK